MKKNLALLMALVMGLSLFFTACGGETPDNGTTTGSTTAATNVPTETVAGEPVTITMVGEGELVTQLMGEKFTEKFPNIKVEFKHPDGTGWVSNEALVKWAAAGVLPDIVTLQNPDIVYQNNLVIDLKPYFDKDPESSNFYQPVIKYSLVNDKMLMIPYQMSFYGVMVNKSLISSNNIPVPEYGWTIDEYVNIVKKLTKKGSLLGSYNAYMWQHLPPQYDDNLEIAAFNRSEKKYVLGDAWQNTMDVLSDLVKNNYTAQERLDRTSNPDGNWDNWYALSREIIGDDDPWTSWQTGKVATWMEASYWSKWDENNATYSGYEWDFYPVPVPTKGDVSRPCIITDNYAITRACQNPDAAYEVLKFFTYSQDGFNARYDIWKNYDAAALKAKYPKMAEVEGTIPDTMSFNLSPVDKDEVRTKWAELYNPKPGLKHIIDTLSTSNPYVDGFKVIPGWNEVAVGIIEAAVKNQIFTGEKSAADLAAELEKMANDKQAEIYAAMEQYK